MSAPGGSPACADTVRRLRGSMAADAAALDRERLDLHRQAFLRALRDLGQHSIYAAIQEGDATTAAIRQILAVTG